VSALALTIAGLDIAVTSAGPLPEGFVGDKLAPFVAASDSTDPDVIVELRNADPRTLRLGEPVFIPGSVWRMHKPADGRPGWAAVISYADEGRLSEHAAVVEADENWRHIKITEGIRPGAGTSLLNLGAGELIVRTRIILEDGLVFHASAIDDSGRGVLMVGHAGAGKSTQASIWSAQNGVIALSDDRVAVRISGDEAVAYGTPWGGTAGIARNHAVPLRAILVLEQSPTNELRRLTPEMAAPLLLARCFLPYWSRPMVGTAMDVMIKLLQRTPVYLFRCLPNESVVPVVRAVL
jgi:hypothetical protein